MKLPLFPLDLVLFPRGALPLHIFEERYKEMIGECLSRKSAFGVVRAQREGMAVIGCSAVIVRVLERYPDGRLDILCEGSRRFEIENLDNSQNFLRAEVDFFEDDGQPASRSQREQCAALHFEALALLGLSHQASGLNLDDPIAFMLASSMPSNGDFQQELLMLRSDAKRTERIIRFYESALPKLRRSMETTQRAGGNGQVM